MFGSTLAWHSTHWLSEGKTKPKLNNKAFPDIERCQDFAILDKLIAQGIDVPRDTSIDLAIQQRQKRVLGKWSGTRTIVRPMCPKCKGTRVQSHGVDEAVRQQICRRRWRCLDCRKSFRVVESQTKQESELC